MHSAEKFGCNLQVAHRRYDLHCRAFLCDSIALWFMERVGFLTSLRNSWGGDGRWGAVGSGPDGQLRTQRGQFVFDLTLVTEDCGHVFRSDCTLLAVGSQPGFHYPWGSLGDSVAPSSCPTPHPVGGNRMTGTAYRQKPAWENDLLFSVSDSPLALTSIVPNQSGVKPLFPSLK